MNDTLERWNGFKSLQTDVVIIRYFMDRGENVKVRQKQVIEHFRAQMSAKTVREHLYKLVNLGILIESYEFKGTYILDSDGPDSLGRDLDHIVKNLLGRDFYMVLTEYWSKRNRSNSPKQYEEEASDDEDYEDDAITREAIFYQKNLDRYLAAHRR